MEEETLMVLYANEEEEEEEIALLLFNKRCHPNDLFIARETEGFQKILIERHLLKDELIFRKFFRVNINQFNYLLSLMEKDLKGQSYGKVKHPISPAEKLSLTLRFLATGELLTSLSFAFRISPGYISRIVKKVLQLCSEELLPIFLPTPSKNDLQLIAQKFYEKWNFPNCITAIDGKHIRIFCPGKSGSLFFNYKDYFFIVLLAIVDANYKFLMVDIGSYGEEGDNGILEKSNIGKLIKKNEFYSSPTKLPNTQTVLPYVIVGDGAFRLSTHMMKPFTRNDAHLDVKKAIFNYRLSRARRVSENAFGLLSQVFRIFYTPIALKPEVTDNLIMTTCCIHNMLRDGFLEEENVDFFQFNFSEQLPTQNMISLCATGGFANAEGFDIRDEFMNYFNSNAGSVQWQIKYGNKTN